MGDFSGDNANSKTTGVSPFFANYGYYLHIQAYLFPARGPEKTEAETLVKTLKELQDVPRSEMTWAQEYHQEMTNRQRVSKQAFKPGNRV